MKIQKLKDALRDINSTMIRIDDVNFNKLRVGG